MGVTFDHWLPGCQPAGAQVDAPGHSTTGFEFVATRVADWGERVENAAEFSHASGCSSSSVAFTFVKYKVYLPTVLRTVGP